MHRCERGNTRVTVRSMANPLDLPSRPPARPANPVRISRIGTNSVQVTIRPPADDTELMALVGRMEQLVAAGFESIDVVYEDAPGAPRDRNPLRSGGDPTMGAVA